MQPIPTLRASLFFLILLATTACSDTERRPRPPGMGRFPGPSADSVVRAMSFNIRYGTADDGDDAWPLRRDLVFDVIRDHEPDVLGVQEALRFQLDEIAVAVPGYAEAGVGRTDGDTLGEYAAILYDSTRFSLLRQGTFWFSDSPEEIGSISWGNRIPRICTWVALLDRASGRSFYVYNVHWDHQSQESRERSAGLLLQRIAERTNADAPVVVTGDFNAGETNSAFRTLVEDPRANLNDSFRMLYPDAVDVGTFNGFRGNSDGEKIDAILVSAEWDVLAAGIIRTNDGGRYPSDHYPVTAVLGFGLFVREVVADTGAPVPARGFSRPRP